jgi:hypothetical protein
MQSSLSTNLAVSAVSVETPVLEIREEKPVCEACGQALLQSAPRIIQVHAGTIADIYDVWMTGPRGKRIGPKVLVIELKVQR